MATRDVNRLSSKLETMYLCILPMRGVKRLGIKGKLAPCYISLFPIMAKLRAVAYRLELPPSLAGVHNVFHVSQLKKCLKSPTIFGRWHSKKEATWQTKDFLRSNYPDFLPPQ
jgi:hypothetical protein